MSSQTKLIKDILSSYNTILENKILIQELEMVKLDDVDYPNVKHDNDGTQNDSVNKPLIDDIQSAASSIGVVVTITTAKSGHESMTDSGHRSRHMDGTGVDVAIINGIGSGNAIDARNGNAQFRELGNRLKDALVGMGYKWNIESGNDKAVLWQTNTGGNHFDHIHISNRTSNPSTTTQTSGSTTTNTGVDDEDDAGNLEFINRISTPILKSIGIGESKNHRKEKRLKENIQKIKKLIK